MNDKRTPAFGDGRLRNTFVRNSRAMDQLEIFLVSSVTTILLIRLFLELTGYPQLGGGTLHIAHMLWGGLGMLAALLVRLMFLGRWVEYFTSFVGGVGFGAFIDEIGKFVTQDNDYFFAPAFSLMYVVFVLIYLVAHWALTSWGYSRTEYLMNSLNRLQEYRDGYLPGDARQDIALMLEKTGGDALAAALDGFLNDISSQPVAGPSLYHRARARLRRIYIRVVNTRYFAPLLNFFFLFQMLTGVSYIVLEIFLQEGKIGGGLEASFSAVSLMISSGISATCIFFGVFSLHRSRLAAYKWFERAMLVNILLSQIFLFTINQLSAITGLLFSLLVLGALRLLVAQESEKLVKEQLETAAGG